MNKWISVKERLPELMETLSDIRVMLRDGSELNGAILQSDGDWWWRERFFAPEEVTHWRLLPTPPEEKP